MFKCEQFYQDYDIQYHDGSHHHPHCREGWIQIECPVCTGNPGLHLGFNTNKGFFVCWRCGFKPIDYIIRALTGISYSEAIEIRLKYGGAYVPVIYRRAPKEKDIDVEFPPGTRDIVKKHIRYLQDRNFNPKEIKLLWDIRGTGPIGRNKNRIIIPIYHNNILCSYTGRSIKSEATMRYINCDPENERRSIKYCLYGYDQIKFDRAIVVEGIFDVFRLGVGAVATFGTKVSNTQINLIVEKFKKVFILFDSDEAGTIASRKLAMELTALGCDSEIITTDIDGDPGDMSQKDANYLMRDLLLR